MRIKLLLIAIVFLFADVCQAQWNYEMVIEKSDGSIVVVNTKDLMRTYFLDDISCLYCPDDHHPHMIDLGLPSGTKWACCNVGADKPDGYGGYYAWGETEEKSVYNQVTYQYCTGEDTDGDGYYDQNSQYQYIGDDIAGTSYDVAHVKWGGSWVMPSLDQIKELLNNCTYEWTTLNGVKGNKFTGKNGGTIFLPAAGYRYDSYLDGAGSFGCFWSSTQSPSDTNGAYYLYFNSGDTYTHYGYFRNCGFTVRPVSKN